MPKYSIDSSTLTDVADAVRDLDGNPDTMTPAQMANRIRAFQPGSNTAIIADDYDATATYDVGDYCIHEGGLYVCTTSISTAEAWTAGHWEEVTVGDELSSVMSDLNDLHNNFNTLIVRDKSANLFNKDGETYEKKATNRNTGELVSTQECSVQYVPFDGAGTYSLLYPKNYYGNTYALCLFDSSKNYLRTVSGTGSGSEYVPTPCSFVITSQNAENVAYIGYCYKTDTADVAMLVKSASYPSEYIPYYDNGYIFNGGVSASHVTGLSDFIDNETSDLSSSVTDLSSAVDAIEDTLNEGITPENTTFIDCVQASANLFNKDGTIKSDTGFYVSGTNQGQERSASGNSVQYVPFDGVGVYSLLYPCGFFGKTNIKLNLYDSSFGFLRTVSGSTLATENVSYPATFTISEANAENVAYIGYCFQSTYKDSAMLVKSDVYPTDYIPYQKGSYTLSPSISIPLGSMSAITDEIQELSESVDDVEESLSHGITADMVSFIDKQEASANLFNRFGQIIPQKAINLSDSYAPIGTERNADSTSIQYVPFNGAGTYWVLYPQSYYGTSLIKLCLYDENKDFIRAISGTRTSDDYEARPCSFNISDADALNVAFIGYCFKSSEIETSMVVKGNAYPSEYIPYHEEKYVLSDTVEVLPASAVRNNANPLYEKKVVFDGDSICRADILVGVSTGWAKYIGENNKMEWHNVGISGGTITAEMYSEGGTARHWVSRYIDTIYTIYPELDYLILEGGTNDADLLTNDQIGTLDPANYSTFDDTTFIGALESLFYKALNYYPNTKIGFIIAHKMGRASDYGYESADSPSTRRRRKFFELAIQVCKKWGIPYIDLWEGSPLCPKLLCYYDPAKTADENTEAGKAYRDGQHLTQVGYNIISPKIEAWMKTL